MATRNIKVSGPAWAGIETALLDAALKCGLELIFTHKIGLVKRHYYFTVSGPEAQIAIFVDALQRAITKTNGEWDGK